MKTTLIVQNLIDARFFFSEILAIDPMSVRTNVNIAKIFTSILPKQFRNTEFARICIDRALLFHPGNSKANHRMALLMLSTEVNKQQIF